jgi:hypothetical protein
MLSFYLRSGQPNSAFLEDRLKSLHFSSPIRAACSSQLILNDRNNKLNIIHSVNLNFIFKVRHMYNLITLFVHFHRSTCFEPLTWVHLQYNIIFGV